MAGFSESVICMVPREQINVIVQGEHGAKLAKVNCQHAIGIRIRNDDGKIYRVGSTDSNGWPLSGSCTLCVLRLKAQGFDVNSPNTDPRDKNIMEVRCIKAYFE